MAPRGPGLPADVAAALRSHLGRARNAVRRHRRGGDAVALAEARRRVDVAKRGLGGRGEPWWDQDAEARRRRWQQALDTLATPPP